MTIYGLHSHSHACNQSVVYQHTRDQPQSEYFLVGNIVTETIFLLVHCYGVHARTDDVGSGSVDMDKKPANWNSVEFQRPSKALTVPLTFSKTATKLLENQTALKAV